MEVNTSLTYFQAEKEIQCAIYLCVLAMFTIALLLFIDKLLFSSVDMSCPAICEEIES